MSLTYCRLKLPGPVDRLRDDRTDEPERANQTPRSACARFGLLAGIRRVLCRTAAVGPRASGRVCRRPARARLAGACARLSPRDGDEPARRRRLPPANSLSPWPHAHRPGAANARRRPAGRSVSAGLAGTRSVCCRESRESHGRRSALGIGQRAGRSSEAIAGRSAANSRRRRVRRRARQVAASGPPIAHRCSAQVSPGGTVLFGSARQDAQDARSQNAERIDRPAAGVSWPIGASQRVGGTSGV